MRYALVKDGIVYEVFELTEEEAAAITDYTPVQSDVAMVGWTYDGTTFTDPTATPPVPTPEPVPVDTTPVHHYAVITDGVVSNIIVASEQFAATVPGLVMTEVASIGWTYDGTTFTAPVVTEPTVPVKRHITQLAFLNRFTDAEAVGIDLASIGSTVQAATIRRYLSKVQAAKFIDLDRTDTRNGVIALETSGLIGSGRALQILDTPIEEAEKP